MASIFAFSREQVRRLTGLSDRQLKYWDDTGFFSPHFVNDERRGRPNAVAYSFRDLVGLRTVASLRKSIPLQELRKVGAFLHERYDAPWSSLSFYVANKRVYFDEPESEALVQARGAGQIAFHVEMQRIADETDEAVQRLNTREPKQIGVVSRTRSVMHNVPVLEGTRIPTAAIWDFHDAGYDVEGILKQYPGLTAKDVEAAIEYERVHQQQKRAG